MFFNRKIYKSKKGNAAIEFALLLPIMLMIFFGMAIFTNYMLVSRKIDSAANDIAFILSREGRIAQTKSNYGGVTIYTGGKDYITSLIRTTMPILVFPLNYNIRTSASIPLTYDYTARMMGQPLNVTGSKIRLLWEEKIGSFNFGYTISGTSVTYSGRGVDSSIPIIDAAKAGDSFIIFGLSYPYNQGNGYFASIIGGAELNIRSLAGFMGDFLMPTSFNKLGAYAVRVFPDPNSQGNIIPYNDMNICTDCTLASCNINTPWCRGGKMDGSGGAARQPCKNSFGQWGFDINVSGCKFD